ncbi:MAG: hypothetical protein ACKVQA_06925 [Burkholderiales bacterium]
MSIMTHSATVPNAMFVGYQENGACWTVEPNQGGSVVFTADPEEDKAEGQEPLCVLDFKAVELPEDEPDYAAGVSFLCDPESLDEFIAALIAFRDEWSSRR